MRGIGKLELGLLAAGGIIGLIIIVWAMVPSDFDRGNTAYNRGEYDVAMEKWRPLADKGDTIAQNNIGIMYERGQGVERNDVEAAKWYQRAAAKGHAAAQNNLGLGYFNGRGVKRNYGEALKWYRRSAEQGDPGGQNNLGTMIRAGLGVPIDSVKALMWFELAAAGGSKSGAKSRDQAIASMSDADIAKAKKMAKYWKPKR